jgi:enoyl-CoA hydratase/carnithine racemase
MVDQVQLQHQDSVLSVLLNRPKRKNALSGSLLDALSAALDAEVGETTAAVVLSGAGGCFSAGADLMELSGTLQDIKVDEAIASVTSKIRGLPIPVIAAIEGACLGGAVDIALSCDLRIAAENAFFQVPATRLNLLYNPPSIQRLYRRLGRDALFQLLVVGQRLDAHAAHAAGLVSRVVKAGDSLQAAHEIAQQIGSNHQAAVAATKGMLNALDDQDYDPDYWEGIRRQLLSSPERLEAVADAKRRLLEKADKDLSK